MRTEEEILKEVRKKYPTDEQIANFTPGSLEQEMARLRERRAELEKRKQEQLDANEGPKLARELIEKVKRVGMITKGSVRTTYDPFNECLLIFTDSSHP